MTMLPPSPLGMPSRFHWMLEKRNNIQCIWQNGKWKWKWKVTADKLNQLKDKRNGSTIKPKYHNGKIPKYHNTKIPKYHLGFGLPATAVHERWTDVPATPRTAWKSFENRLKVIWKSFESHLKIVWKSFENCLKVIWKSFESHCSRQIIHCHVKCIRN